MDTVTLRNILLTALVDHPSIVYLGVFGSVARGQDTPESDIDLLVRFSRSPGLIAYIQLEQRLSKLLGRKVDLATERSLHPIVRSRVVSDLKTIYEKH